MSRFANCRDFADGCNVDAVEGQKGSAGYRLISGRSVSGMAFCLLLQEMGFMGGRAGRACRQERLLTNCVLWSSCWFACGGGGDGSES